MDTLINNAGVFVAKPFTEYTEADFAHVLAVNLAGFFHVTQGAVRQMLAQGSGHVVNLTTTLVGQPVKGVPSALASLTKGGLDAVTRSLAIEYADKGIRVNAVAPGVEEMSLRPADLEFHFRDAYGKDAIPEAYERLLSDAMQGDAALFMRDDEIERAWAIMDPFIAASERAGGACPEYAPGSPGPACAEEFLARTGRQWVSLCHH